MASTKAHRIAGKMRDMTKAAQSAKAPAAATVALIWNIVSLFVGCSTPAPKRIYPGKPGNRRQSLSQAGARAASRAARMLSPNRSRIWGRPS